MEMNVWRSIGRGRPIRPAQLEMYQAPSDPARSRLTWADVVCGKDVALSCAAVDNVDAVGGERSELILVNDRPPSIANPGETQESAEIRSTMTKSYEMMKELEASNPSGIEENPVGQEAIVSVNQTSLETVLATRVVDRKRSGATDEPPPAKKARKGPTERKPRKPRSLETKLMKVQPARRVANRQVVPEEEKTAEYYENRRKNTQAARKCRESKRAVDEQRVETIKTLKKEVEMLHVQIAEIKNENEVLLRIFGPPPNQQ